METCSRERPCHLHNWKLKERKEYPSNPEILSRTKLLPERKFSLRISEIIDTRSSYHSRSFQRGGGGLLFEIPRVGITRKKSSREIYHLKIVSIFHFLQGDRCTCRCEGNDRWTSNGTAKEHRVIQKSREARVSARMEEIVWLPSLFGNASPRVNQKEGEGGREGRLSSGTRGGVEIWPNLAARVRGISRLGKIKFPPPVDNAPVSGLVRGGLKKRFPVEQSRWDIVEQ